MDIVIRIYMMYDWLDGWDELYIFVFGWMDGIRIVD
jgi:hypothetical protein